jgi:hypothetical protein
MIRHTTIAFLLLAGLFGSPAQAGGQRFGRISIAVPGSWTLKLLDRVEDPKVRSFPFYLSDKPGNNSQDFGSAKLLDGAKGSFSIWPAGGTDVKTLAKTGEDCDLQGRVEYMVAFDYGYVGLKAFNHVFYLYGKEKSACLLQVEAKTTDTGSTLSMKLLNQADYSDDIKKFKAGKKDKYVYKLNGTLTDGKNNIGSSDPFISVEEISR